MSSFLFNGRLHSGMTMLSDSHVHLDSPLLVSFLEALKNKQGADVPENLGFQLISNSTSLVSSQRNLQLGIRFPKTIFPFVGIHPEAISSDSEMASVQHMKELVNKIRELSRSAFGIGEIGLDPKYGSDNLQIKLLESQIEICEGDQSLAVSFHSRDTILRMNSIISSYHLSNKVLFHWFNGSDEELSSLQGRGYYVSFGPALIFSKRVQNLFLAANEELVLAETDSPLFFLSMSRESHISPFAIASVIFKMAQLRGTSFQKMSEQIERNVGAYLSLDERKTH